MPDTVSGALALLGTTLTAYAYVWETIELSEEKPKLRRLGLVQVDAALGIVVAGLDVLVHPRRDRRDAGRAPPSRVRQRRRPRKR